MTLRPLVHDRRSASRRKLIRWVKRGLLALGALAIVGLLVRAWLPKPVVVDVAAAHRGELVTEVDEDGKTRVHDRFVVASPIFGNLERVELEAGAQVTKGDTIARIAPPNPALLDPRAREEASARLAAATARQRRAETAIGRAIAARDSAARDAERARTLEQHAAITKSEREHSELAEQLAAGDLAAAEAERTAAAAEAAAIRAVLGGGSTRVGRTIDVIAPTSGRVLRIVRDSAGPIAAGAAIIELGDPRAIEVVVDVLSSDGAQIAPGMEVLIEGWGGDRELHGHVRLVEPSAFTKLSALGVEEQRVNVIVALDDPPATLGDGFRVDARILTWRGAGVLLVPQSAVFRDRDRWVVYVVEAGRAPLVDPRARPERELLARDRRDHAADGRGECAPDGTARALHDREPRTDGERERERAHRVRRHRLAQVDRRDPHGYFRRAKRITT